MIPAARRRVELPAVLSLGSNLGERESTLRDAVHHISQIDGVVVTAASGIVETPALKPHGVDVTAPAYLNAVLIVRTSLDPETLLDELNAIEREHGRVRAERWGDRTLDIDIVDFAGLQVSSERLTLPHPRAAERGFVLAPWFDVDPSAELVGFGSVESLLASTTDDVRRFQSEALL